MELKIKKMISHRSHHLIRFHIMHIQNIEIVETAIKGFADLKFYVND
jgi:hypothetical protein